MTDFGLNFDFKLDLKLAKYFFWFKRVPDQGPEERESNLTVLYLHIIKILVILLYFIIIK
jgi:hypothetical protein